MAESESGGERTEEPTQQRRDDFRKRGQVAQTRELASVFTLLAGLLCLWGMGRFFMTQIQGLFTVSLTEQLVESARAGDWRAGALYAFKTAAFVVAPIGGVLWIVSALSGFVQIGFLNNEEALTFKPERIDPLQGLKRMFSLRSVAEAVKAIFKICLVTFVAYLVVKSDVDRIPHLSEYGIEQIMVYLVELVFKLFASVGALMAVLAAFDYGFQKWDLEKRMRMTKQEIKEEMKSREGDPLIKARIRRVQREMATRRMMSEVPKADVVITNPTHIAVALRYSDSMVAPVLIAKGADAVAEKIKALAREHKVPVIENKPLARTIFKTMKLGQVIPRELYAAVAEVLSYVFRMKKKVRT